MRTWDVFFPDVLPDVLGCPEPTIERHLQRAAVRFCAESRCWREDLDRITTRAGRATYDLPWPDQAEGVELIGAALDGRDIALEVTDGTTLADRRAGNTGRDRVLSDDGLVTITVMPTPGEGQELRLAAILRPTEAATGLPDRIADRYRTAIAAGALSTLLILNKAAWANPALAQVKAGEFQDAIDATRQKVWKAHTNARRRTVTNWY
jgi:hypothetical protein